MTISSAYSPDTYNGTGSLDTFAITFEFLSDSTNVKVSIKDSAGVITEKTAATHYNISGSNVVFTAGNIPAATDVVIIELDPSFLQESDYTENSEFPAETLEADIDKTVLRAQYVLDQTTRAVRMNPTVDLSTFNPTLPDPTANYFIRFNSTATGMEAVDVATLGAISVPVSVANGGTGATSFTANYLLYGNGTSAIATSSTAQVVSGIITVNNGATSAGYIDFVEDFDDGSYKTSLTGNTGLAGDIAITLPATAGTLAKSTGDTYTGTHDFGGADDLEIPNGAAPTVDTAGQIAIDTTITDHTGLIKYHDGTEELTVIALPTANLVANDGYRVAYNATNNEFEMVVAGAATKPNKEITFGAASFESNESSAASLEFLNGTTIDTIVRAFDDTTEEYVNGKFQVPGDIDTSGTVTFRAYVMAKTAAASKNIAMTFAHLAVNDSEDFDGSYTEEDSGDKAIDATQDDVTEITWTETVANLAWAANDLVFFRLSRDPAATDDLTGDMFLFTFAIEIPRS